MVEQVKIVQDISLLYELSLSVGSSLNFEENAEHFLKKLMLRKKISFASIWIKSQESNKQFQLSYSRPNFRVSQTKIDSNHYILKQLKRKPYYTISYNHKDFHKVVQEKEIHKGAYAFFNLPNIGFLKLYSIPKKEAFSNFEMNQLLSVIEKFAQSIIACQNHKKLIHAEKALTFTTKLLNLAQEAGKIGNFYLDLDTKKLTWSREIFKIFGYSELPNFEEYLSCIHPDYVDAHRKECNDLEFNGIEYQSDIKVIKPNNLKEAFISVIGKAMKNDDGRIYAIYGTAQDITERKLIEKTTVDNEVKFRSLYEQNPLGVVMEDEQKNLLPNKKFCEMLGYTKNEFNKMSVWDITHPDDREKHLSQYSKLHTNKTKVVNLEKRYIKKDGSILWGNVTISQLLSFKNGFQTHLAIIEDVSEKKKAANQLQNNQALLTAIFDGTQDKICALDLNFNLLTWNKSFEKVFPFFGIKKPKKGSKLIPKKNFNKIWYADLIRAANGETFQVFKEFHLDGVDEKDFLLIGPLKNKKNDIIGVYIHGRTVTDSYNAQNALKESEEKLKEAHRLAKIINWELDLKTKKVKWSDNKFSIFNLNDPVGAEKNLLIEYTHPDDKPRLDEAFKRAIKGKSCQLDIRKVINGKTFHVKCTGKPLFEKKKVVKIFGTFQDITNIKEAEKIIIETNKKYEDLFENMYDALLRVNQDGFFEDANKAATKLLGYTKKELPNVRILDIVHPDDLEKSQKYLKKLIKEGYYSNYEGRIITKSGQVKYLQVNSNAIYENNKMIGSRDLARDITRQKLAEFEVKKLAAFPNVIPNPVIRINKENKIDFVNKAGKNLLNLWESKKGEQPPAYIIDFVRQTKEKNKSNIINIEYFKHTYTLQFTPINEDGIVYIYGRDISQLVKAEMKFLDSESKLSLFVDQSLDALITADKNGRIIEWNHQAEKIFGYKKEEVVNKFYYKLLIPKHNVSMHFETLDTYRNTGQLNLEQRLEMQAIRKDKSTFDAEVSFAPYKTRDEIFFSAFVRNISKQKDEKIKREALLNELELVNNELRDFAYVVSHDLKAPLRAIGSLAHWLEEDYKDVFDDAGKANLRLLTGRVKRMHNFIDGILQYSRLGRVKGTYEIVNLNNLAKEVIEHIVPPPHFKITIKDKLPTINCDKIRIGQVFQNLLSNAIKYNDKKKGIIEIDYKKIKTKHQFSFKDNGPGIEEKYFEKIFLIFQTLQSRDRYESTGIGLTIVKRIVENHGGEITVKSKINKGSTFTFTLNDSLQNQIF